MQYKPLTPDTWTDFEALFGTAGAYGGCWCMYWRITRREFSENGNSGNRKAMRRLVSDGVVPGILVYEGDQAIGWCSVAPRSQFGSLNRSPVLKRLDDEAVWSIVCFYVARPSRGDGLSLSLLEAAEEYVRQQGGQILEAYPSVFGPGRQAPDSLYMGVASSYEQAGFVKESQPSRRKWVMRKYLD